MGLLEKMDGYASASVSGGVRGGEMRLRGSSGS